MPDCYTKSPEITNDFAAQAARDAFGRYYVHPRDRKFQDHPPSWQKLGDVSDGVVDRLRRRRDHHLAGIEVNVVDVDDVVDHDMAEVWAMRTPEDPTADSKVAA